MLGNSGFLLHYADEGKDRKEGARAVRRCHLPFYYVTMAIFLLPGV
jgi:hypothetical protein